MPARSRIPSRTTTFLVVAAAHGLVWWLFWRAPGPLVEAPETFASILFLLPVPSRQATVPSPAGAGAASRARRTPSTSAPQPARAARQSDTTTAITPPSAVPGAGVDWSAQLGGAADSALKKEKRARDLAGALTRKFVIEADPRNPGHTAMRDFRWYDAGIHRVDTRAWIPGLWISDHCVLIAFVIPACMIGHIETHGDLFQNMVTVLDESEATPRPNDVP
jgi:hypothetical protein